jgi:hypothetical protein
MVLDLYELERLAVLYGQILLHFEYSQDFDKSSKILPFFFLIKFYQLFFYQIPIPNSSALHMNSLIHSKQHLVLIHICLNILIWIKCMVLVSTFPLFVIYGEASSYAVTSSVKSLILFQKFL